MSPVTVCPICRETLSKVPSYDGDGFWIRCVRCGVFHASRMFAMSEGEDRDFRLPERLALSRVVRTHFDDHGEPLNVLVHRRVIAELVASRPPPRTVTAQIHELLLRVASVTHLYGEATELEPLLAWAGRLALPEGRGHERSGVRGDVVPQAHDRGVREGH